MSRIQKARLAAFPLLVAAVLVLVFTSVSFGQGQRYRTDKAWSFGVHGDTQFSPRSSANPNYVAKSIITQVDNALVNTHHVKFVFGLGDMADYPRIQPAQWVPPSTDPAQILASVTSSALVDRAAIANNDLYAHQIGFFPMRGNHETFGYMGGSPSYEPRDSRATFSIPLFKANFPQTQGNGPNLFGATNFNSPNVASGTLNNDDLVGLSYSFDYGIPDSSARFIVLDTEKTFCGTWFTLFGSDWPLYCTSYPVGIQQPWITNRLSTRSTNHAFILAHRPPMAENHTDSIFAPWISDFGNLYLDTNLEDQNTFYASMYQYGARYFLSGHDHLYTHSILASPNGQSKIQEIISPGLTHKFYKPAPIPDMVSVYDQNGNVIGTTDAWAGQKSRETPLAQELNNIGYYVYTVDGPRVNVDYYSDITGNYPSIADPVPTFNFVKKESFGYSLNGKDFGVTSANPSYTVVEDRFRGTTARIIDGAYVTIRQDFNGRDIAKAVNTGWTPKPVVNGRDKLGSDIFSLWGMDDLTTGKTDTYVLSMNHDFRAAVNKGQAGIAALNSEGKWVNAVTLNIGTGNNVAVFVDGLYKPGYALGTWGIDSKAKTAWAVLNYNADFAIADFSQ
jgi:hypothetical protein